MFPGKPGRNIIMQGLNYKGKARLTDPFVTIATIAAKGSSGSGADYSFDDIM